MTELLLHQTITTLFQQTHYPLRPCSCCLCFISVLCRLFTSFAVRPLFSACLARPPHPYLRDRRPLVLPLRLQLQDHVVFLWRPVSLPHVGSDVVRIPLATLAVAASRNVLRHRIPVVLAELCHAPQQRLVLLATPVSLPDPRPQHLLVPLHALRVVAVRHHFSSRFLPSPTLAHRHPVALAHRRHCLS